MDKQEKNSEYLLLFKGGDWKDAMSPQELQDVMGQWMAWFERWTEKGVVKGGQPLRSEGRIVTGKADGSVYDGPFAESKEAIGGYFLVSGVSLEEALEVARECPTLKYGLTVEVRPLAEICPIMEHLNELAAGATA